MHTWQLSSLHSSGLWLQALKPRHATYHQRVHALSQISNVATSVAIICLLRPMHTSKICHDLPNDKDLDLRVQRELMLTGNPQLAVLRR